MIHIFSYRHNLNSFKRQCKKKFTSSLHNYRHKSIFSIFSKKKTIDERVIPFLVCPITKEPLKYDPKTQELIAVNHKIVYRIKDGIPVLIPDEAYNLE